MINYFHKTREINGSLYVKVPLRSSAVLKIRNDDKYYFIWSIPAHLHPIAESKNGHATKISNCRQYFIELNLQCFHFLNGFK